MWAKIRFHVISFLTASRIASWLVNTQRLGTKIWSKGKINNRRNILPKERKSVIVVDELNAAAWLAITRENLSTGERKFPVGKCESKRTITEGWPSKFVHYLCDLSRKEPVSSTMNFSDSSTIQIHCWISVDTDITELFLLQKAISI